MRHTASRPSSHCTSYPKTQQKQKMSVLVLGATGNVGKHIVKALLDDPDDPIQVVAASRDIESDGIKALLASCPPWVELSLVEVDMTMPDADVLAADLAGHSVIVLNMPQALAPADMIECQQTIAEAVAECMEQAKAHGGVIPLVVKMSSYGIDGGKHSQGPLGEAHRIGEAAFRDMGIPLVSLRPTSFFSNFVAFDWPNLQSGGREISSPLGQEARVNWVACEDIGRVAAAVTKEHLQASQGGSKLPHMFRVVNVVGPSSNTLTAPEFCRLVGQCLGEGVTYKELALPTQEDYRGLWLFLRAGGFDVQDSKAEVECRRLLGGQPLTEFRAFVTGLLQDMKEKQDKSK